MNEQKSLLTELSEAIDRYRAGRRAARGEQEVGRPPARFLRWVTPNGGALLLVAALIATAQVWAKPLVSPASAPGPSATTINYQGRLADSGGSPIDNTNPGLGMTFALYDVESGGSPVWTETHANVPVSEGLFSVRLGSISALDTSHLTGDRWLGIQVGTDPEMAPREKLTAVPYAMQAGLALTVADGSITTDKIADGAVTQEKAPTLLQSANGQYKIIRSGNQVIAGTDGDGFATIEYPCFPNGVRTFIATNGHWNAQHIRVVGHNQGGRCSTQIAMSSPTTIQFRINWIAIGN